MTHDDDSPSGRRRIEAHVIEEVTDSGEEVEMS